MPSPWGRAAPEPNAVRAWSGWGTSNQLSDVDRSPSPNDQRSTAIIVGWWFFWGDDPEVYGDN